MTFLSFATTGDVYREAEIGNTMSPSWKACHGNRDIVKRMAHKKEWTRSRDQGKATWATSHEDSHWLKFQCNLKIEMKLEQWDGWLVKRIQALSTWCRIWIWMKQIKSWKMKKAGDGGFRRGGNDGRFSVKWCAMKRPCRFSYQKLKC